ncbi:putative ubiquitin-like-specific protease 1B [Malus domestica]|uniref:putative ubiquitin-like-specific protease 1B n=1 Tax=Malus domestica TaxID=3750 RepID=UPI003976B7CC
MEMNLKAARILVYDSLRLTTHSWKVTTKLAPIFYVLLDILQSMLREVNEEPWPIVASQRAPQQDNGGDCGMFNIKVIEFLSTGIPLVLIKPQNILAFRLRMAVDMLHGVHNV